MKPIPQIRQVNMVQPVNDVLMGIPKSDLLGATMAVIHVTGLALKIFCQIKTCGIIQPIPLKF